MESGKSFAAIASAIEDYYLGMIEADEARLRRAMHPRCFCIGHYEGRLEWDDRELFIAGVKAAFPGKDALRPRCCVLAIDVTGDTAVARVENDYIGQRFIDYLTLLRGGDAWVITNKAFVHHGPALD